MVTTLKGFFAIAATYGLGWVILLTWEAAPWLAYLVAGLAIGFVVFQIAKWLKASREERDEQNLMGVLLLTAAIFVALAIGTAWAKLVQGSDRRNANLPTSITPARCIEAGGHVEGDRCFIP
jgi:hypothetical protein